MNRLEYLKLKHTIVLFVLLSFCFRKTKRTRNKKKVKRLPGGGAARGALDPPRSLLQAGSEQVIISGKLIR
jgi:hypothetical protein